MDSRVDGDPRVPPIAAQGPRVCLVEVKAMFNFKRYQVELSI